MALCLVTGGAGFIGSHLVDALLARGHVVRVFDNFSTGSLSNLTRVRTKVELIDGDISDLEGLAKAIKDVELVFHEAALPSVHQSVVDPLITHRACGTGALHVLLAARDARVRRIVYGGSASAYGNGPPQPRRESEMLQPVSPYAAAQVAGENYCVAFGHVFGLETVRLRYFNVFGPRQRGGHAYSAVVPLFLEAMIAGLRPVIHGDGLQTRDFTHVDDVVQANLLAADAPRVAGRVYNIASGRSTTLLELVERINSILGTDIRPIHTSPRPGEIRHSAADITRAQADLGYCPCTDLGKSLRRCIEALAAARKGPKFVRKAQRVI
jgi:UDP-glucose 4-epimerase